MLSVLRSDRLDFDVSDVSSLAGLCGIYTRHWSLKHILAAGLVMQPEEEISCTAQKKNIR